MSKNGEYVRVCVGGRLVMEHRLVWEATHGPVPAGCDIHHKNLDKTDNRLDNLECLTFEEHRRLHNGWQRLDDVWYRSCSGCGELKPATDAYWYFHQKPGQNRYLHINVCKTCHIRRVVEREAKSRAERGPTHLQRARAEKIAAAVMRRASIVESWRATAEAIGWSGHPNGLRQAVVDRRS